GIDNLPMSIKVLLEAVLRNEDNYIIKGVDIERIASYNPSNPDATEIPFKPARVLMQDFTGVPAVVDLAAMRSAVERAGGNPEQINPLIPVDLVIDHSVMVDAFGSTDALAKNADLEFERNRERYLFLHWGQKAFKNFRVVPPASGICHQVNLEYLGKVVQMREENGTKIAFPDSLVGTDSHTTMINGLGIVGWGVGGIEAEAVMLGQPLYMLAPEVIGFKLTGEMPAGATATDLVLRVTEMLRQKGVVGRFVEFFGSGLSSMTLTDRATIANMAPEYGATMGFFPVDANTLTYLRQTGRDEELIDLVERYCKEQGMFRTDDTPDPLFKDKLELALDTVEPSLAGPTRPQDRVSLKNMKVSWKKSLTTPIDQRGFGIDEANLDISASMNEMGELHHGDVVIAAITSCTNTSNPAVMLAAGLLAKKAVKSGLKVKPFVKTSLAPGSRVVQSYLDAAGLSKYLDQLGFNIVGFGCTTCIGNSGPLPEAVHNAIVDNNLITANVLSGNRNFTGRISPVSKASYLASPPLVVAYALAGTVDIDLDTDPIGENQSGEKVYLSDVWPSKAEIGAVLAHAQDPEVFRREYQGIERSNETWNKIHATDQPSYNWDVESTYIQEPPFFIDLAPEVSPIQPITNARVMAMVGDSITTDHISPAGAIAADGPAGSYLTDKGIERKDFNSYGSRRGNDQVMTRGTFANVTFRNMLTPDKTGGWTRHFPSDEVTTIYNASLKYKEQNTPTIVLAGMDYGMGSSRDWAAKGTFLLGIKAVIAQSFERIHRSNLVGMGVLPLQFLKGENAKSLGLNGEETFTIDVDDDVKPGATVKVNWTADDGRSGDFVSKCRLDSVVDVDYYRNGGILQTVLRNMMK
ncbi:aconitate hydratase AcnA, partial [Calditrichota bacterium]